MDKEKRNKIIIIILTILIIINAVVAIWFYIKNKEANESLLVTEKNYEEKISNISKELNAAETNTVANTAAINNTNTVNTTIEVAKVAIFDPSKIKNGSKDYIYVESEMEENQYFSLSLKAGKAYIEFFKNFEGEKAIELGKKIELTGFDKKIVSCHIGKTSGQSMSSMILLFLMEDGTVEYIPILEAAFKNSLKSSGKIQGLENIVRFVDGYSEATDRDWAVFDASVFAMKNNGDVYLIGNILKSQ